MNGAGCRRKGANGELELVHILEDATGLKLGRNLTQTRDGGYDIELHPFRIEVKRCQVLSLDKWWQQAVRGAGDLTPVLAYRQNRKPWTFILPLNLLTNTATKHTITVDLACFVEIFNGSRDHRTGSGATS